MVGEIISAEEARRLREAATPGPWTHGVNEDDEHAYVACSRAATGGYYLTADRWESPWYGEDARNTANRALMAAAPDLARTVDHLHAELAAEREAVLAFLLGMARTAETPQARGLIATIRRALELRYHRDPLRTPRDVEVSDD